MPRKRGSFTMNKSSEHTVTMYREYGISEWHEKCLVLSAVEVTSITNDLMKGIESPLVTLVRLPFPQFARAYLQKFAAAERYLKDPAFTYKLFLMTNSTVKVFCSKIRNPELTKAELEETFSVKYKNNVYRAELDEFINTPLDVLPKIASTSVTATVRLAKFIYLTRYINFDEAKKMDLGIVQFLEAERHAGVPADGYELEEKLKMLNSAIRLIFVKLLGLYGNPRKTTEEVAAEMKISASKIQSLYNELIPYFLKTLGDFKHKIGYVDADYLPGDTIEYANKAYRKLDLAFQIHFIYNHTLTADEKLVLSGYSNREASIYIAYKYMYHDREKVAKYLSLGRTEIYDFGVFGGLK